MGMYDTVVVPCATCGKMMQSQTKVLGECCLASLGIGDEVNVDDCIFELKEECDECGAINCVSIKSGRIDSVKRNGADVTELGFWEVG